MNLPRSEEHSDLAGHCALCVREEVGLRCVPEEYRQLTQLRGMYDCQNLVRRLQNGAAAWNNEFTFSNHRRQDAFDRQVEIADRFAHDA